MTFLLLHRPTTPRNGSARVPMFAIQNIERGEQSSGAMALVVTGLAFRQAGSQGRIGAVRSRA